MLSVIIPVYKVEDTLDRCVESVLGQDCVPMEVILVDDGSPDGSPALCDRWAACDARVRVVHQQNGGLSAARNAGLEVARGDYVTFVDSDDYLSKNTYRPLMELLSAHEEYDLVEFSAVLFEGKADKRRALDLPELVFADVWDYWFDGKAYEHAYAWNKLYRRSLFAGVRFPVGKLFEDANTLPVLLKAARCVATVPHGCYHYVWNKGGITSTAGARALTDLLDAYVAVLPHAVQRSDDQFQPFYQHALNIQMEAYGKGAEIILEDLGRRMRLSRMWIFKCNVKILLLKALGMRNLCKIYKRFYMRKECL